jgi:hypothetical protein
MLFDNYINLIRESHANENNRLVDKIKTYQQRIVNLYKELNKMAYSDFAESEYDKIQNILRVANQEYKDFINSNLDDILKHSQANTMYREFAVVAKQALAV